MAGLSQRVFALSMAALFIITTVALSAFYVSDIIQSRKQDEQTKEALAAQQKAQEACPQQPDSPPIPKPEVYKLPQAVPELQTTDLEPGSGQAAKNGDCLVVKYYGTLAANGELFDENFTKTTAFGLLLGQGQVITGWDKGLVGMQSGGIRRLVIPAAQAYGAQERPGIPASSDLVFVVKLVEIKQQ